MTSLVGVRTILEACATENTVIFTSLIDNGTLAPYKFKEILKRNFEPPGVDWYPSLGKKQAPVGLYKLSTNMLQDICIRDLPEAREYFGDRLTYFLQNGAAHGSTETSEEHAGMQTINDLTKMGTTADSPCSIVTFPSEFLEDMCTGSASVPANLLRATMTTCTILREDTILPPQHSNEGTTVTTLLSGSVTWLVWPPTDHNIRTLQTAYENFAEDFDEAKMDVASDLEGGMIFMQTEGDGLRIPPFCPMISLATKTSVLATTSYVTVENYINLLQKLPLIKAWHYSEACYRDDHLPNLSRFNSSILKHLDLMLNGDPENEERNAFQLPATTKEALPGSLLGSLLEVWDGMKDDLAAMMGPKDSDAMVSIWEDFLTEAKGRKCWICSKEIRNKQRGMAKHFLEKHWVKATETTRVNSMEAGEEDHEAEEASTLNVEDGEEMEVDQ